MKRKQNQQIKIQVKPINLKNPALCLKRQIQQKLTKEHQDSKPGLQTVDYIGKYGADCYSIHVRQKPSGEADLWDIPDTGGFHAFALAYDLGILKHLDEFGVDLEKL